MKTDNEKKINITASITVIFFLLLAFFEQPYYYYFILHFLVCIVSLYYSYIAYKIKYKAWIWLMVLIAILFNPLFPIHLTRGAWLIFDAIVIIIFLYSIPVLNFSNAKDINYREAIQIIISGIIWSFVAFLFWYHLAGYPIDELALIRHSYIAIGFLESSYEDENEDVGVYTFHTSDGRKYHTTTKYTTEEKIEIEYLPNNPNVNRAKGDGCQSIYEWFWRKIGVGSLCLILVIFPGIKMIKEGIKEIIANKNLSLHASCAASNHELNENFNNIFSEKNVKK